MPPNVTGPCTVSAGSINATGYGELQYDCTYPNASAAAAAAPLEFVAIGRISSELQLPDGGLAIASHGSHGSQHNHH